MRTAADGETMRRLIGAFVGVVLAGCVAGLERGGGRRERPGA